MNRREEKITQILNRFLNSLGQPGPTQPHIETIRDRVLQRLESERSLSSTELSQRESATRSYRKFRQVPALAAAAAFVVIAVVVVGSFVADSRNGEGNF